MATTPADSQAIEHFVRGTLGCGCPDGVFDSIALERVHGAGAAASYIRLLIGNRLLIYVLGAAPPEQVRAAVPALLRQGLEERDSRGLNRLRLVVTASHSTPALTSTVAGLAGEIGLDERSHLHVVAAGQLPASLR